MIRSGLLLLVLLIVFATSICDTKAQTKQEVRWIGFEQLDDSLTLNPKKIFIDFYTDWCTYCRKMDKVVFTKPEVIRLLNEDYHTVKMNAESMDTIRFDSQVFINDQVGKSRRPLHQLAQLLATRDGQFTPPVIIVLNEKFEVIDRYFEYLDSKRLLKALN